MVHPQQQHDSAAAVANLKISISQSRHAHQVMYTYRQGHLTKQTHISTHSLPPSQRHSIATRPRFVTPPCCTHALIMSRDRCGVISAHARTTNEQHRAHLVEPRRRWRRSPPQSAPRKAQQTQRKPSRGQRTPPTCGVCSVSSGTRWGRTRRQIDTTHKFVSR